MMCGESLRAAHNISVIPRIEQWYLPRPVDRTGLAGQLGGARAGGGAGPATVPAAAPPSAPASRRTPAPPATFCTTAG